MILEQTEIETVRVFEMWHSIVCPRAYYWIAQGETGIGRWTEVWCKACGDGCNVTDYDKW